MRRLAIPCTLQAGLLLYYSRQAAALVPDEHAFPLDDSWIHMVVARNLAEGGGFGLNPGEPRACSTSPLYTLVLAGLGALTGSMPAAALLVGILCSFVNLFLVQRLGARLTGSEAGGTLAATFLAVLPPSAWAALSGLEPPFYTMLCLLAVGLSARLRGRTGWVPLLPYAVAALAAASRPELFLLAPLILLDEAACAWMSGGAGAARRALLLGAAGAGLAALLCLPYFWFNAAHGTGIFPMTTWKIAEETLLDGILGRARAPLADLFATFWDGFAVVPFVLLVKKSPLLAGFAGLGVLLLLAAPLRPDARARSFLPVAIPAAFPLVVGAAAPVAGSTLGHHNERYAAHLVPFLVIWGAAGMIGAARLVPALTGAPGGGGRAVPAWARRAAPALVVLLALARQPAEAAAFALSCKNINEMHVSLGKWLRDRLAAEGRDPRQVTAFMTDIGAVTYFARCRTVDLGIATLPRALPGDLVLAQRIQEHLPEYVFLAPSQIAALEGIYGIPGDPEFFRLFRPAQTRELRDNVIVFEPVMVVVRPDYEALRASGKFPRPLR